MCQYKLLILIIISITSARVDPDRPLNGNLNDLSETFLQQLRDGQSTKEVREQLEGLSLQQLETGLQNDREKLAFWINIYNAYILHILRENPQLYEDRGSFFKKEQVPIAGRKLSFEKIEHGIIRKSQWPYGLGYIRKWFPGHFERKLRVEDRDYRIHFALNCGAKDCPPVAIYTPERLNAQLDQGTVNYLARTTRFDKEKDQVRITPLFQWFRGDFSPPGILEVLKRHGALAPDADPDKEFRNYDWTLELNNFTEL